MQMNKAVRPSMMRDGMRYWRLQPHPHLRACVLCYYFVEPDLSARNGPPSALDASQLILPDGHAEIVFALDGEFERWRVNESGPRTRMNTSYLIGGRSHSVHTRSTAELKLAGIKLHPHALRALAGMPLGEFRDATLTLTDLNSTALLNLEDAVATARDPASLAQVLDDFLLRALRNSIAGEPCVDAMTASIQKLRGAVSISGWAREQRISERTLERRFVASMGISPKQFARIVRFKSSYHRFICAGLRSADKRHLEGYYDQSHFDREYNTFLGITPAASLTQPARYRTTVSDHLLHAELVQQD